MTTPTVYEPKPLGTPSQLGSTTDTLYTSPAGQKGTQITSITLTNTTTTPRKATVYLVEKGGTAGDSNALCKDFVVPADGLPYELIQSPNGKFIEESATIQGVAEVASAITVHRSGVELN